MGTFVYYLRTGYKVDGERVNPDFPDENFENHLKVYKFLKQFARGADVIDIGCGTGYGTAELSEVSRTIVGVDLSSQAIAWARRRYPKVKYLEMNVQDLQFPDASFDLIVSSENLEHLPDQKTHVKELARVLRPNGLCFVASPNPEMFVGVHNPHHTKENTYQELTELFSEHFGELMILENTLNPETSEGLAARDARWQAGRKGTGAPAEWDTDWLHNTHSFFCFARKPM